MNPKSKKLSVLILPVIVVLICGGLVLRHNLEKKRFLAEESARAEQARQELEAAEKENPVLDKVKETGDPTIVFSSVEGAAGETVTVTAEILNNPGILGSSLTLSYDESVLTLENADNGEAFADVLDMIHSKELTSGCNILWDGEAITEDQIRDGVILTLTFKIRDDAPEGKNPITVVFDKDGTVDNDLNPITFSVENGFVTVTA